MGRTISRVLTGPASYFFLTPPARVRRHLGGRRVEGLARHGKYLVVSLDDRSRMLIHLGMTGQLFCEGAASPRLLSGTARASLVPEAQAIFRPDAHTHLQLHFRDRGPEVYLRDVRKFGKLALLGPGASHPRLDRLGPDALDATGALLFRASRGRRVAIKVLLLDQSVIAGIGNIYADEALFAAGIRPTRRATRLTRRECEALADRVRAVLERSIVTGGSSISDFIAPDGADGHYQDERRVYARGGEPCRICGTPIRRASVGQRATHWCPSCQR